MSDVEDRLKTRIRLELFQLIDEAGYLNTPDVIDRLVPAILDEIDTELEESWMYRDLNDEA